MPDSQHRYAGQDRRDPELLAARGSARTSRSTGIGRIPSRTGLQSLSVTSKSGGCMPQPLAGKAGDGAAGPGAAVCTSGKGPVPQASKPGHRARRRPHSRTGAGGLK